MSRWRAGCAIAGVVLVLAGVAQAATPPRAGADGSGTNPAELVGEGESWPEYTIRKVENDAAAAQAIGSLQPFYNAQRGESEAGDDLAAGNTDFAVTGGPLSSDQITAAQSAGVSVAYVPYALGAVSVVAAVRTDIKHGYHLITGIKMSITTLERVMTHGIVKWNDPVITGENPDIPDLAYADNPDIVVVHRRDSSATNIALISAFLADPSAASLWAQYAKYKGLGPNDTPDRWPADPADNGSGITSGSSGVIYAVMALNPADQKPLGLVEHTVGYVGPQWAATYQAPIVSIYNSSGHAVAASTASITSAFSAAATFDPSTRLYHIDYGKITAPDAYPLPLAGYLAVPTTGLAAGKGGPLAGLIRFALGPDGQADVAATGMAPLPAAVTAAGLQVAQSFDPPATTTTSTSSTSTTAPTTTSTTIVGGAAPATTLATRSTLASLVSPARALTSRSLGSASLPRTGLQTTGLLFVGLLFVLVGSLGRRSVVRSRQ